MLNPPTEVTAKCQISLSKIKTLFPLMEAKKKDQVTIQDIFQDNHKNGPISKKLMTEEGGAHFSVSSLAEDSVTSAGSVNPTENFRVLVKQKNASFEEASDQLINHIKQFLDNNGTPYFMKSMDCIIAFQKEAIKFQKSSALTTSRKCFERKWKLNN
ncbi:X-ray repair cross-complementing protein 5 [Saguinus oedipus]|uniref:X-ray repair cross-complementing protein 5 n=1 Tax=Saguinus oedipus TaxID=9490 RepID=A0ABQ9W3B1_SAGOE|nr:X-ray repair cross-complementing protein 5 [Saguinus oedipus]